MKRLLLISLAISCDGEPFYEETLTYVRNLQEAGVEASVDVYHGDVHAFDMFRPGKGMGRPGKSCAKKFECESFITK